MNFLLVMMVAGRESGMMPIVNLIIIPAGDQVSYK